MVSEGGPRIAPIKSRCGVRGRDRAHGRPVPARRHREHGVQHEFRGGGFEGRRRQAWPRSRPAAMTTRARTVLHSALRRGMSRSNTSRCVAPGIELQENDRNAGLNRLSSSEMSAFADTLCSVKSNIVVSRIAITTRNDNADNRLALSRLKR